MTRKEQAKSDFVDQFSKLPPLDVEQLSSIFQYMQNLNRLLDNLYDTAFDEGFRKYADIDIKNKP